MAPRSSRPPRLGAAPAPGQHAPRDSSAVDPWLRAAASAARAAWPEVVIAEDELLRYLVARRPDRSASGDAQRALRSWRVDELYLCCGCALRLEPALAAFRSRYQPVIDAALRRLALAAPLLDEARQALAVQLLSGDEAQPPLITTFAGLGSLSGWLRVVAARTGRRLLEREKKLVPCSDERIAEALLAGSVQDPELLHVRNAYRRAFVSALGRAIAALAPRQINLLRHRFGDGLSLEQIGAIYRVHQSTASRWMQEIRDRLLQQVEDEIVREMGIAPGDYASVLKLVQSGLELSFSRLLAAPDAPSGAGR